MRQVQVDELGVEIGEIRRLGPQREDQRAPTDERLMVERKPLGVNAMSRPTTPALLPDHFTSGNAWRPWWLRDRGPAGGLAPASRSVAIDICCGGGGRATRSGPRWRSTRPTIPSFNHLAVQRSIVLADTAGACSATAAAWSPPAATAAWTRPMIASRARLGESGFPDRVTDLAPKGVEVDGHQGMPPLQWQSDRSGFAGRPRGSGGDSGMHAEDTAPV